jgi:cysteine desulfurase/selenocysteine lyase
VEIANPRFDVITVSARKFLRGPRGSGSAVFSDRFLNDLAPQCVDQFSRPWLNGEPQIRGGARRYEFGETSYAVRMGFGYAAHTALQMDWGKVRDEIASLATRLRTGLNGINVQESHRDLSGLVTFSHATLPCANFVRQLGAQKINIAAPAAAYTPLWFGEIRPLINRISPHSFSAIAEIEAALEAVEAAS